MWHRLWIQSVCIEWRGRKWLLRVLASEIHHRYSSSISLSTVFLKPCRKPCWQSRESFCDRGPDCQHLDFVVGTLSVMLDEFALNLRKVFDESRGQEETLRPTNHVFSTSICYISKRNPFRGQKSLESSKRVEAWNKLWSPSWMPKGAWNSCNSLELFSRDSTYSNIKARPTLESENVSRWEHCVIFSKKKFRKKEKFVNKISYQPVFQQFIGYVWFPSRTPTCDCYSIHTCLF